MSSLIVLWGVRTFFAVVLLVLGLVWLGGCSDAAHWYSRTFYDVDCRPEKLQDGRCVPASAPKGAPHAQTARP